MDGAEELPQPASRTCIVSLRRMRRHVARCCIYEAEDVVASIEPADIVVPTPTTGTELRLKILNQLSRRTTLHQLLRPGVVLERPQRKYELLYIHAQSLRDLLILNAWPQWRRHCHVAVCRIDEIWANDLPKLGRQLDVLNRFDMILLGCAGTREPLQDRFGTKIKYQPSAVDTLAFDAPDVYARVIDIANIGRRSERTHNGIRDFAQRSGLFYYFDTLRGPFETDDVRLHRWLYADIVRRSRVFITNHAKAGSAEPSGQMEFGYRFFEALAGGAVLVGVAPSRTRLREEIGRDDVVVPMTFDCIEPAAVIEPVLSNHQGLEEASRRNRGLAQSRHDWLHRWSDVLAFAGLAPTAAFRQRQSVLARAASRRNRPLSAMALPSGPPATPSHGA